MSCPDRSALVISYVDGELTAQERSDLETHLAECALCAREVAEQSHLKALVRGAVAAPRVPDGLSARVSALLDREDAASVVRARRTRRWPLLVTRGLPALSAAALLLGVFVTARDRLSPLLRQALHTHHKEIPLDVVTSDCEEAARWLRPQVGFNVQPPTLDGMATCEGGRVVNVTDGFGAYFRYRDAQGKRFGVLVVDEAAGPVSAPEHRVVAGKDVYLGSERGAASAAFKGSGNVWYVVTSDDETSLNHVVEASFRARP